jgi:hypothetical protein
VGHYHASIKVAKKEGDGRMRASAHYAYLGRTGAFEKLRSTEELVQIESGNMPSWAQADASIFWLASDRFERENGTVYRELEAALPRELSLAQQKEIVEAFRDTVLKYHPYTSAIHIKDASDGQPQPHVHLMWSERKLDGIEREPTQFFKRTAAARKGKDGKARHQPDPASGGCRKVSMQPRLDEFRELWATLVNEAYRNAGLDERVSHRSLADQGIKRKPERHLGPIRMRSEEGKTLLSRRKATMEAHDEEAHALKIMEQTANMRSRQNLLHDLFTRRLVTSDSMALEDETIDIALNRYLSSTLSSSQTRIKNSYENQTHISPSIIRRAHKPRAYSSEIAHAKTWRSKALIMQYGIVSDLIATYWRMHQVKNRREVVYEQKGGENRVIDKGALITARNGNQSEIAVMIELARMKKWPSIVFSGSEDFKLNAMTAALRAGLKVSTVSPNDEKLLDQIKINSQKNNERESASTGSATNVNRSSLRTKMSPAPSRAKSKSEDQ